MKRRTLLQLPAALLAPPVKVLEPTYRFTKADFQPRKRLYQRLKSLPLYDIPDPPV